MMATATTRAKIDLKNVVDCNRTKRRRENTTAKWRLFYMLESQQ